LTLSLMLCLALCLVLATGCQRSKSDGEPSAPVPPSATPQVPAVAVAGDPPGSYMGRRLAPTMSHEGAPWLTREEREAEENTSLLLKELELAPGDVACDLGAGNGYHTLRMARAVAPRGRVIAIDIQPEMLKLLRARASDAGIENIETVLGESADPKLPAATCDLLLMVDVYHELDEPAAMLRRLARALTKRGTIALVEFRAEDPEVPIKELHKMSKAQIMREYQANDFTLVRSFDGLPWQHLMFFAPRSAP
jgi:SAM-dependent methyltransferase